jgi:hypothetical protein
MRNSRPPFQSPRAPRLRKVTVLVPEGCAEGLRQFARDLCQRQEAGWSDAAGQWRKLSPSAELMVDPGCGARCAIRDTGAAGSDHYHWTVTVLGEPDPVAAGRTAELVEARSQAEAALAGQRAGITPFAPHKDAPVTDHG